MKRSIKNINSKVLAGSVQLALLVSAVLPYPQKALAACTDPTIAGGASCAAGTGSSTDLLSNIKVITNTLILVVGIASVIMIIIGALRYVLSAGNEKATSGAKDNIIYAVVGLVIAVIAYAIVNFVLSQFK
jgi:Type IV secretion system pilin